MIRRVIALALAFAAIAACSAKDSTIEVPSGDQASNEPGGSSGEGTPPPPPPPSAGSSGSSGSSSGSSGATKDAGGGDSGHDATTTCTPKCSGKDCGADGC